MDLLQRERRREMAKRPSHDVELRTCHDIRHWCVCARCGYLGDDRRMITVGAEQYHDACAVANFTTAQILEMPIDELNKFTLCATGINLMKAIMKRCSI